MFERAAGLLLQLAHLLQADGYGELAPEGHVHDAPPRVLGLRVRVEVGCLGVMSGDWYDGSEGGQFR